VIEGKSVKRIEIWQSLGSLVVASRSYGSASQYLQVGVESLKYVQPNRSSVDQCKQTKLDYPLSRLPTVFHQDPEMMGQKQGVVVEFCVQDV
jgi:hypothetical protein